MALCIVPKWPSISNYNLGFQCNLLIPCSTALLQAVHLTLPICLGNQALDGLAVSPASRRFRARKAVGR
jgi:hypothetical protein